MTCGHEVIRTKAHRLNEHASVGAPTLPKHAPVHPTPYTWPPTAHDEAPHFTEAVSASLLYIKMIPRHSQDTIHFPHIFTHSTLFPTLT